MAPPGPLNVLSLCSGIGGLDLGLRRAAPRSRVVCYVEREAFALAVLARRFAEGALDPAPCWTDLASFDGRAWRGVVDLVAGGFPCQDVSNAGKRAGLDGERSGLWREFARVVREVRPGYVFLENVRALVVRGLDRVLGDLAGLGFDAEWGVFSAGEQGAPHLRERIFVLARALPDARREHVPLVAERRERRRPSAGTPSLETWAATLMADAGRVGRDEGERHEDAPKRLADALLGLRALAHADRRRELEQARRGEPEGRDGPRQARDDVGEQLEQAPRGHGALAGTPRPWPPGPSDQEAWREVLALRPDLEPAIRRVAHGLPTGLVPSVRRDRLRALGNAVVPATAEHAFHVLWERMT